MVTKEKAHKNFEILNYEEKKKFIDTLLIIGSILVAMRFNSLMIPFFVLFIVSSLSLLLMISALEKMSFEDRDRLRKSTKITLVSFVVASSFSAIIADMSVQGVALVDTNGHIFVMNFIIVIVAFFGIYAMICSVLYLVLVQYKNVADNWNIDVVD